MTCARPFIHVWKYCHYQVNEFLAAKVNWIRIGRSGTGASTPFYVAAILASAGMVLSKKHLNIISYFQTTLEYQLSLHLR